jgi:membrane-bound metal-dependent hydrolase YbcI (DUF457 family)
VTPVASPVAHSLVGVAGFLMLPRAGAGGRAVALVLLAGAVFLSNLPDADVLLPLLVGDAPGIAYHRGFSHSFLFPPLVGVVAGGAAALVARMRPDLGARLPEWRTVGLAAGLLVASHVVLDVFTADGRAPYGVPFLWPFSDLHVISPVPLFAGVRNTSVAAFFAPDSLRAMATDLWLALPVLLLAALRHRRGWR